MSFTIMALHPDSLYEYFRDDIDVVLPASNDDFAVGKLVATSSMGQDTIVVGRIESIAANKKMMTIFGTSDAHVWATDVVPTAKSVLINDFQYQMALTHGRIQGEAGSRDLANTLVENSRAIARLNIDEGTPKKALCPKCQGQLLILLSRDVKSFALVTDKRRGQWITGSYSDKSDEVKDIRLLCSSCNWGEEVKYDQVNWVD